MTVSPTPGPHVASSTAAASRTERVTTCSTPSPLSYPNGPRVVLPWLTLSPTSPQQEAGMRIEPPASLACAAGTSPAATAAADPPLDPPGERSRSHGLWVGPKAMGS